jgi:hypothetical protein
MEDRSTLALPSSEKEWLDAIEFKVPQEHDTTGLVNVKLGMKAQFQLIGEMDEPVTAYVIRTPFECLTVDDLMSNKCRGNLTLPIQLNKKLWTSLNALDKVFDQFMLTHSKKLFSKQDAEFLKKDPSSILLKHPKPLARFSADNQPDFGHVVNFRITARGSEVKEIIHSNGKVDKVNYKEMLGPLPSNGTRIALVNGNTVGGKRCISTTIKREIYGRAEPKTRIVGPGDFVGGLVHSARFSISHWSLVNGCASITLRLTDIVLENVVKSVHVPHGFVVQNDEVEDEEDMEEKRPRKKVLQDSYFDHLDTEVEDVA